MQEASKSAKWPCLAFSVIKGLIFLRMVTKLVARKEGESQKCFFFIEIEILYKKTSYSRSFPPFELV